MRYGYDTASSAPIFANGAVTGAFSRLYGDFAANRMLDQRMAAAALYDPRSALAWSVSIEGYAGAGGGFVAGRDEHTNEGFFGVRFGFGTGGGFSYNRSGGRPGSSGRMEHSTGGLATEVFGNLNLNAGPLGGAIESNWGRNYPFFQDSQPYGRILGPSGPNWETETKIKGGPSFGGQILIWSPSSWSH